MCWSALLYKNCHVKCSHWDILIINEATANQQHKDHQKNKDTFHSQVLVDKYTKKTKSETTLFLFFNNWTRILEIRYNRFKYSPTS